MITLGIESSCDETSCGILNERFEVLGHALHSQIETHAQFGGVVPEIAARAHLEKISPVLDEALNQADLSLSQIDQIAYTHGPGLMGPLLIGSCFAQTLASSLGLPAFGINHLEGHISSAYLANPKLKPPFLCLIVSGGHTELWDVQPGLQFKLWGKTRDDAAGEAFDKCGKMMGLGYPAGPKLSKLAESGNPEFVKFPRPLKGKQHRDFSFSGLKTAVSRHLDSISPEKLESQKNDLCASLEQAIVDTLLDKTKMAFKRGRYQKLAMVGGVSANKKLRESMKELIVSMGGECIVPPPSYCTDNGAMIAAAAVFRGIHSLPLVKQNVKAGAKLSLEMQRMA